MGTNQIRRVWTAVHAGVGSCELLVFEAAEDGFLPINANPIERSAARPVITEVRHVMSMGGQ